MKKFNIKPLLPVLITLFLIGKNSYSCIYAQNAKMPPPIEESKDEPVKYVGGVVCDRNYYDGRLRYAIGVHTYQPLRANRTNPPEGGMVGWTYNHQPYLAYWNGRFYLQYLSNLTGEHLPPGRTLLMISKDGFNWTNPQVVFPEYSLPEIKGRYPGIGNVDLPEGEMSVMHQRMGFYVAPNGRLLTLAFYSFCPHPFRGPNNGQGLGRVVREVYKDGTYGPIYFIRYNRNAGWDESNTKYPFYTASGDEGFLEACESLLADKLYTLQWQEEDFPGDDFYTLEVGNHTPKAFAWTTRPDGAILGIWKSRLTALSPDNGQTWTDLTMNKSLMTNNAKTWIQKTKDGRYALVYNHSATGRTRFPAVVMTSDDAHIFNDILLINGEVPPMRFFGYHKNLGTQYFRGITEGNGEPPGDFMWVTYSTKEDIWISRTPVPIRGAVDEHVDQDFQDINDVSELTMWNLYVPQWAPVTIAEDPVKFGNKVLKLKDEEPYDYAIAQRAFPGSRKVSVEFRINVEKIGSSFLFVEVQDKQGRRPMSLRFNDRFLIMDRMSVDPSPLPIEMNRWMDVRMELDCDAQQYTLYVDGKKIHDIRFAEEVESLERLVFRTGPWRGDVRQFIVDGEPATPGLFVEDLSGTDDRSPGSIFLIDDVKTE